MTLPNLLTLCRILVLPFLVFFALLPGVIPGYIAAVLFGLAAATDWFDGYLARRWGMVSPLGTFLDPIADKLLVTISLFLLVHKYHDFWLLLPCMVIVGREITIVALRQRMAELQKVVGLRVSVLAQVKTALQMAAILVLLVSSPTQVNLWSYGGYVLLYLSALMTLWSMAAYMRAAWPSLKDDLEEGAKKEGAKEESAKEESLKEEDAKGEDAKIDSR